MHRRVDLVHEVVYLAVCPLFMVLGVAKIGSSCHPCVQPSALSSVTPSPPEKARQGRRPPSGAADTASWASCRHGAQGARLHARRILPARLLATELLRPRAELCITPSLIRAVGGACCLSLQAWATGCAPARTQNLARALTRHRAAAPARRAVHRFLAHCASAHEHVSVEERGEVTEG